MIRGGLIAVLCLLWASITGAQVRGVRGDFVHGSQSAFPSFRRAPLYNASLLYGVPYLFADYPTTSYAPTPAPQVIVVQPAVPTPESQPDLKPQSVLIEAKGDQYVRLNAHNPEFDSHTGNQPAEGSRLNSSLSRPHASASSLAPVPLPPAILIYRDGRTEQVPDYAIIGGILYARGNYWEQGYWSKPIQIAALDIPATIHANHERGVKFVLPSSPNEVITRP